MLKLAALALLVFFVGESKQDNFFEPYLAWFGLKGTYIPYLNDDVKEIERYKAYKKKAQEGLRNHFAKQREQMRKKFEL
ncbi:hypothetical protein AAHC03_013549 [Spirometra sp. Aus1]